MKTTYLVSLFVISFLLFSCGGGQENEKAATPPGKTEKPMAKAEEPAANAKEETESKYAEELKNKGIGPVKNVELGEIDQKLVKQGETLYNTYCIACHKLEEDYLGPAPKGILERRSPEWVMNLILNTEEMNQKDPIAQQLVKDANGAIMVSMGLKEDQARAILEFFRTL